MSIEAHHLQTWIGAEVLDRAGEKLGKLEDVYFRGDTPLAVTIRSGLTGRKHHAAVLRNATVSRDHLHVDATAEELVGTTNYGLDANGFSELAAHDDRLLNVPPAEIESWQARAARLEESAKADAAAAKLADEARQRAVEEDAAALRAGEAERQAETTRLAREEAEARADEAREKADR
jgi:hypothetical protein